PVEQRDLDVDDRITRKHAIGQRLAQTFFHRRDEFPRHGAALDGVDELEPLALLARLHLEPYVTVLAAAARLLDELAFDLHGVLDRFAIRDLRRTDVGLDAELALHPVDQDLEVELAHPRNDRLP